VKEAVAFISAFAQANQLPKTYVIDVGYQPSRGWALVEANATWGAGLNGCDPFGAARCIAWATVES
jgi:ATP-grasp domain, R2K clade family 2